MEVGSSVRLLEPPGERGWWPGRGVPGGIERNARLELSFEGQTHRTYSGSAHGVKGREVLGFLGFKLERLGG